MSQTSFYLNSCLQNSGVEMPVTNASWIKDNKCSPLSLNLARYKLPMNSLTDHFQKFKTKYSPQLTQYGARAKVMYVLPGIKSKASQISASGYIKLQPRPHLLPLPEVAWYCLNITWKHEGEWALNIMRDKTDIVAHNCDPRIPDRIAISSRPA